MSKGLTIIEIIIAIFALSVGIIGVLQMFPVALHHGELAKKYAVASYLSQAKLEELISYSYGDPPLSVGTNTTSTEGYQIETTVNYVDPNNNLNTTTTDSGIKKIKVVVSWEEGGPQKSIGVSTLFGKR